MGARDPSGDTVAGRRHACAGEDGLQVRGAVQAPATLNKRFVTLYKRVCNAEQAFWNAAQACLQRCTSVMERCTSVCATLSKRLVK